MGEFPLKLDKRLETRKSSCCFRVLSSPGNLIDFSSNDYLGFAGSHRIFDRAGEILRKYFLLKNGSGGSRLLTGNHVLYTEAEALIATYHKAEAALIFNSGYDANLGLLSAIGQRGDYIFYDELIHASIRDGIRLSNAKAVKFTHNDLEDLAKKIDRLKNGISGEVFLVTESIFSMDGDSPQLECLVEFCDNHNIYLIIDEAHAVGGYGAGLMTEKGIQDLVFARLVTFGKALGAHGAAIVGSAKLKDYLVNFARSLIYSTSLPPHAVATILAVYEELRGNGAIEVQKLQENIACFKAELSKRGIKEHFLESDSAIHCCVLPGNERVKAASANLQKNGFDVKPILSPTVPEGSERLRICLHSFNSREEIEGLAEVLKKLL